MIARRTILLGLVALPLAGCMHARWTVVRQATPAPYDDSTTFFVEPLHLEHALVHDRPEAEYAAAQNDDMRALWETSKKEMSAAYVERVVNDASLHAKPVAEPNDFVIVPIVTMIEPGSFAGVTVERTDVHLTLVVRSPSRETVDEIRLRATVPAGSTNPTIGGRLRSAATELGAQTVEYLRSRAHG